jgi:acetylornithine/N-succinyldiaminopimelate aminotransferase
MRAMLVERGRAMGSVLGLFPPLRVEESEIDTAVSAIDVICALEEQ